VRPEDRLQSRCRMLLDSHLQPPCYWSSVGHERKQTLIQGQMQKARGVRRGLPDVMVWAPGYFLGVELKVGSNTATEDQRAFGQAMAALGHGYAIVRSVEQLVDVLEQHGIPLLAGARVAALRHDGMLAVPVAKKPARVVKARAEKPTRKQLATLARVRARGVFV
jgi:hypothetical protein